MREEWQDFVELMQQGSYDTALNQIKSSGYNNIATNAAFWNTLFAYIVDTEELQDTTFKATKIQTSTTAPADLTAGEVYFQVKS